jgi:hypothetical protein
VRGRVRHPGGGRKPLQTGEPGLVESVVEIIDGHTAGCPMNGGKWTYLTITEIQSLLELRQFKVSWSVVKSIVNHLGFGRRALAKKEVMKKGDPDRDQQFKIIVNYRNFYLSHGYPVLSGDTKKKEILGRFHRPGNCLVNGERTCYDHDFASFATGKVVPHGIYDVGRNEGHITLCDSKDTAEFNVDCLRRYWKQIGRHHYPPGVPLLLLLDGGGSNGCSNRLFKQELQDWADDAGLNIRVAHYPAYCSKYNPIEHRLFPAITKSLSGVMLDGMSTMKNLITTRTKLMKTELSVTVDILNRTYETGVKVFDNFMEYCDIQFDELLPKRNYRVLAMPKSDSYL